MDLLKLVIANHDSEVRLLPLDVLIYLEVALAFTKFHVIKSDRRSGLLHFDLLSHLIQSMPVYATSQGTRLMVCNRSWHLSGNPKLVWHPACLINEWGCVDLSMNTLHLKYPFVLFGSEGSAFTFPLFLLSPRIIMLCHCSSTMAKDNLLLISYGTKCPFCKHVPLTLIHSFHFLEEDYDLKYKLESFTTQFYTDGNRKSTKRMQKDMAIMIEGVCSCYTFYYEAMYN